MTRAELGEAGRACELHVGTMSGGMDQAASAMGAMNFALRIDFEPLKVRAPISSVPYKPPFYKIPPPSPPPQATRIKLPADAVFVVSHSLEESTKAVDAEKRYNKRVTEGKLAVKLVAKGLGVPNWRGITTFRHLQETMKLPSPGTLLPAVEKFLDAAPYSLASAAAAAGEALEGLFEGDNKRAGALRVLESLKATPDARELALRARARHVCTEAERVFDLQRACEGELQGEAQLTAMGTLLDASHASCRDDYECSSPRLDAVVAAAKRHGAYGSRLTGAGWGGCAVSLVHKSRVAQFLEALNEDYYGGKATPAVLFASPPGAGAAVYDLAGL